jgi:hypothetical protein
MSLIVSILSLANHGAIPLLCVAIGAARSISAPGVSSLINLWIS